MKYGIQYLETEESYTSKASFLDMDAFDKEFSGKRIARGMYKSANGIKVNADINGASNIIRKKVPNAFKNVEDLTYITKAEVWNFDKFYLKRNTSIPLG